MRDNSSEQIQDPHVVCVGTYGLKTALGSVPKLDYKGQNAAYLADATFWGTPAVYTA